jgi:hypothetical protein cdiviTM7_01565
MMRVRILRRVPLIFRKNDFKNERKLMAGTKAGGLKAAATNKAKYGKGFYSRIGKKGGQNGRTGGFYNNPELARHAGRKGGKIGGLKSKRGKAKTALLAA